MERTMKTYYVVVEYGNPLEDENEKIIAVYETEAEALSTVLSLRAKHKSIGAYNYYPVTNLDIPYKEYTDDDIEWVYTFTVYKRDNLVIRELYNNVPKGIFKEGLEVIFRDMDYLERYEATVVLPFHDPDLAEAKAMAMVREYQNKEKTNGSVR